MFFKALLFSVLQTFVNDVLFQFMDTYLSRCRSFGSGTEGQCGTKGLTGQTTYNTRSGSIDMVIIGRSACTVLTFPEWLLKSVRTSFLQFGIRAILGMSAPRVCIFLRRRTISSFSGVFAKSWLEATMTFTPFAWA